MDFCDTHDQKYVDIGRDVNSNKLIGKCQKCSPFQEGVPYQRINDIQINIDNNKETMIKYFKEQSDQSVKVIRELIEKLRFFKISYVEKIEKAIIQGEQEIVQIQKKCNSSSQQINQYNSLDVEDLITLFSQNALRNSESLNQFQQNLLELLINIQEKSFLLDSYKILSQLDVINFNLFNTEITINLKKYYKCSKHDQPLLGVVLNQFQSKIQDDNCFVCTKDLQNTLYNFNFTEINEAEKIWNQYNNKSKHQYQKLLNIVQKLISQKIHLILEKNGAAQKKLDKFLLILDQYNNSKVENFNQMIQSLKISQLDFSSAENLQQLQKISKISDDDWRNYEMEIDKFHYFMEQKQNQNTFFSCLKKVNEYIQMLINGQINQVQQTKIQFNQISSIKQQIGCYAIAINSNGNVLIAGCDEKINVFEFNAGVLSQQQILDGHLGDVHCLEFIKNKDIFVSASQDATIKIWKQVENNWCVQQTLEIHTEIFCLVINQRGDQIINGGEDKSIRFWNFNNQKWSSSQIISHHQKAIWNLSLNQSESKLISCGMDDLILVMECVQKSQWCVVQKIKTAFGYRLCFISDDMFSFQPNENSLQIYTFNSLQQQFVLRKNIEVNENRKIDFSHFLFPQKFVQSKQVLISKHKNYLNIIRRVRNDEFLVDQCIEFQCKTHYGTISENGEYLVTWDSGSSEIKVRQLKVLLESK